MGSQHGNTIQTRFKHVPERKNRTTTQTRMGVWDYLPSGNTAVVTIVICVIGSIMIIVDQFARYGRAHRAKLEEAETQPFKSLNAHYARKIHGNKYYESDEEIESTIFNLWNPRRQRCMAENKRRKEQVAERKRKRRRRKKNKKNRRRVLQLKTLQRLCTPPTQ